MADKYERTLDIICNMSLIELQKMLGIGDHAPSKYGITASDLADQILQKMLRKKLKCL